MGVNVECSHYDALTFLIEIWVKIGTKLDLSVVMELSSARIALMIQNAIEIRSEAER